MDTLSIVYKVVAAVSVFTGIVSFVLDAQGITLSQIPPQYLKPTGAALILVAIFFGVVDYLTGNPMRSSEVGADTKSSSVVTGTQNIGIQERQKRRNERVRVQIEKLYGPLYFFSSQNETLFELVRKIHSAYGAEYSSKNWSSSEHTQANLKKDTDATIQLANSYVATATENSTAMVDILKSNYAYIDPEDEDVFRQFVLDQARLKQEFPAEGPIKTPLRVYKRVGEISYMRPDFSDRVRDKFLAKKKELDGCERSGR